MSEIPFGLDEPEKDGPLVGLSDAELLAKVNEPASVSVDGVSMSQRSLSELIALDKHLTAKRAARRGLKMQRLLPPGAV